MEKGNGIFILYAFAAVLAMTGVGIAVGERSFLGAVISLIALTAVFGMGFKTKKKHRELAELKNAEQ
ncbi:YlaF family protein [Jeotgalibacillus proteolyticus]|uniref:YlaF family protein n=1 Tax=Jeotgalibacillus proteolyticus TaxID=2082395 RepID=UPI001FD63FE5|nr:YlaF family protein [Jeotgalibacillus proteolyticus]